jgi:nucleotide-binding universal stress UspA family protein
MKKILVPTDLTPTAELGLQLAVTIAERCGASISLVNFVKHPIGKSFSATGDVSMKDDEQDVLYTLQLLHSNEAKLNEYIRQYGSESVHIQASIVDDDLKDGIDEYLKKEEIDLIVMGTSGEENGGEVFTGNHTEQVIKISSCPVLSVRDGFHLDHLKNMVVGVDVITGGQVALGLKNLKKLADCFDAHVHLVHVISKPTENPVLLHQYFNTVSAAAGLNEYSVHILEADDEVTRVVEYARSVRAGLIAVLKNSKHGIFSIFSHHFSDRVVKEVGRPVYTLNMQQIEAS